MMVKVATAALAAVGLGASFVSAQFPPTGQNLTVVPSPGGENVTVSYKEPTGVCTTAFAKQKQYTGWVNIPGEFPTNMFFWFVEARQKTDTLTIWLNGGPGSSSMLGFFAGNGPCFVFEKALNQYETVANDWGWDRASNMLFVDQPNQVGFSYDTPTNGTATFSQGQLLYPPQAPPVGAAPWNALNGTFSSDQNSTTVGTSQTAALAMWHMIQGFLGTFPQFQKAGTNESVDINLFAESYGGTYGPVFAEAWEAQNQKRQTGELNRNKTIDVQLRSLGIINGCVDADVQTPYYPYFAVNNTYGVKALSDEEASFYKSKFDAPFGCKAKLAECANMTIQSDPNGTGANSDVNSMCALADEACLVIEDSYVTSGRSVYDLSAPYADPEPPLRFIDYLNQDKVLSAIGSPVNYTSDSNAVYEAFSATGDRSRPGNVQRLAGLLARGVRVGFLYGDRDYICNWFGGEAVSLAVAQEAGGDYAARFPAAGYAKIVVNDSYVGGLVRQYANLSFSRIFQAGHSVAFYQPETAFQVFARIALGTAVSTGANVDLSSYNSSGIADAASHTDKLPAQPDTTCYVRSWSETCDRNAQQLAEDGQGVVINGVLYAQSKDWDIASATSSSPPSKGPSASAGSASSASGSLTGMYTATSTPRSAAPASHRPGMLLVVLAYTALAIW